jgi:hypothetical protein
VLNQWTAQAPFLPYSMSLSSLQDVALRVLVTKVDCPLFPLLHIISSTSCGTEDHR